MHDSECTIDVYTTLNYLCYIQSDITMVTTMTVDRDNIHNQLSDDLKVDRTFAGHLHSYNVIQARESHYKHNIVSMGPEV